MRTTAATEEVMRRKDLRLAARLRARGWTLVAPDDLEGTYVHMACGTVTSWRAEDFPLDEQGCDCESLERGGWKRVLCG